jgi:hypothetical protein
MENSDKVPQREIDKMVRDERKKACQHLDQQVMNYGPFFDLIHCKDCGHMHTEPKEKK